MADMGWYALLVVSVSTLLIASAFYVVVAALHYHYETETDRLWKMGDDE
jgi:hypothetical protein